MTRPDEGADRGAPSAFVVAGLGLLEGDRSFRLFPFVVVKVARFVDWGQCCRDDGLVAGRVGEVLGDVE